MDRPLLFNYICCLVVFMWACGDSSSDNISNEQSDMVTSCSACGAQQVCVKTFGDEELTVCASIPEACDGQADCFEQTCVAALYDLCGDNFINTACSDTFPPTVISCNL